MRIREKKIYCGEKYLEVDIIPIAKSETCKKGKRSKKKKVSMSKQKKLNDKNAKRYFIQLVNSNFTKDDFHISLTYSTEQLPESTDDAEREAKNFLRRVDYRRKRDSLPPLKYIVVTEGQTRKNEDKPFRIHHHIIMNSGLDREVIEDLWRRRRKKGEKKGKPIGIVNCARLQPDEYGLEGISRYLTKDPCGKKRWTSSHSLVKPWRRDNDFRYTRRAVERIVRNPEDRYYWEKQYPGYWLTEVKTVYNDLTGWSIYLKMRRAG